MFIEHNSLKTTLRRVTDYDVVCRLGSSQDSIKHVVPWKYFFKFFLEILKNSLWNHFRFWRNVFWSFVVVRKSRIKYYMDITIIVFKRLSRNCENYSTFYLLLFIHTYTTYPFQPNLALAKLFLYRSFNS